MRSWKRRIATAWKVLTGKQCLLTDAATRFVYVQHPGRDGQIVQLATSQDRILALDNNGDVWMMRELEYGSSNFQIQFLMESPRRRR
jgi:alpha-tubulin suppressor-like RCC1 family protein